MNYFNTTQETGNILRIYQNKAGKQDDLIHDLFRANPEKELTPEYVLEVLFTSKTPLTSVRRSFNTLEKEGLITKTGIQVNGNYGRKVNVYKLRTINNLIPLQ